MRRRILTAIVGVVILSTLVLTVPLGVAIVNRNRADAVLELERAAERTAARLGPDIGDADASIVLSQEEDALSVAVYDTDGHRLTGDGPTVADAITTQPGIETVNGTIGHERVLARPVMIDDQRVATIRVAESVSETSRRIRRDLLALLVTDFFAVVVAVVVGSILAGRLARPLRAIRDDAVRLGHGDFAIEARRSGVDEIDDTSHALAETAGRLDAVLQRERTFSANASHQLRTPVTSMRLAVESELAIPRAEREDVLQELLVDLDRLETTISTLLAVARDLPRTYEPIDVDAVADRLRARWAPVLERGGRSLVVNAGGQADVRVSPEVLGEILDVLIDNADRHGRGAVRADIDSNDAGHLTVTVTDGGHLRTSPASLFARREPGLERHGLGLALARSLAEAEGGRLVLAEPDPTTFRLVLPDRR